jgi:protein SMG7
MMPVQIETMSVPSSLELVQRLFDENAELQKSFRGANTWLKMRENYEKIILENHVFSEQHNVELALWQLHYKRIVDFRAKLSAALNAKSDHTKANMVNKIRLQSKAFLSEATGFYHELIMKMRAKTGLPIVGDFPEDSGILIDLEKDQKKSDELKKRLISCHRCLIYLGDLARYKGLNGGGDSKNPDFTAASSYYLQAAYLWSSSGNPHHQLAILAAYSMDELMTVYHYFRSLAVDSPFSTAKNNLIVLFNKNREFFSQLHGKELVSKEKTKMSNDGYKAFSIYFVHLNGILFTKTSLETFEEVLSLVRNALSELLSAGPEEKLNFGKNSSESNLFLLKFTSILIFTVHNVKKEVKGQSYADILQHRVLLQNALAAAFDLMGLVIKRCLQLSDPSSSDLLPGILVFMEYLASCPDILSGSDISDEHVHIVSNFWNHCSSFLNKFYCKEEESEIKFALKEDLELRGFLPLKPSQRSLDFSKRRSFVGDKEKKVRVERILAAGKALANVVNADKIKNPNHLSFDPLIKKFVIGNSLKDSEGTKEIFVSIHQKKGQPCFEDEEEDDEEIIFKPTKVSEKRNDYFAPQQEAPSVSRISPQHLQLYNLYPPIESQVFLDNNFKNLDLSGNGQVMKPLTQEAIVQPKIDNVAITNVISSATNLSNIPPNQRARHLGPPPGFSSARPKQVPERYIVPVDLNGVNPSHSNPQYIRKFSGKQALEQEFSWKP